MALSLSTHGGRVSSFELVLRSALVYTFPMITEIRSAIREVADTQKAALLGRFFKTGPGEYAEGDRFIGGTVPQLRKIVRVYRTCPLKEIEMLIESPIHEERFVALQLLVDQFDRADAPLRKKIFSFYIRHVRSVNNWDLVDGSAPHIVGSYLLDQDRSVLFTYARSTDLWKRRIAIIATFTFIRAGDLRDTLAIATILLHDEHDLIHKAVGWMLREAEKKDPRAIREFLNVHAAVMPRTMLRYAIERFPEAERQRYLRAKSKSCA